MILNLLNLYSLMFSFIYKIDSKERPLRALKLQNDTATAELLKLLDVWNTEKSSSTTTALAMADHSTSFEYQNMFNNSSISNTTGNNTSSIMANCYNITVKCIATELLGSHNSTILPTNNENTSMATVITTAAATTIFLFNMTSNSKTTSIPNIDYRTSVNFSKLEAGMINGSENTTANDYHNVLDLESFVIADESELRSEPTVTNLNDSKIDYYDYFIEMPSMNELIEMENSNSSKLRTKKAIHANGNRTESINDEYTDVHNMSISRMDTTNTTISTEVPFLSIWESNRRLQEVAEFFSYALKNMESINTTLNNSTELNISEYYLKKMNATETINNNETFHQYNDSRRVEVDYSEPEIKTENLNNVTLVDYDEWIQWRERDDEEYNSINKPISEQSIWCIRTICEDVNETTTNSSMNLPLTNVPVISQEEQYRRQYYRLKKTFKEIEHNLTSMCWETSLGQELSKVIVFDGVSKIHYFCFPRK